jgi:3-hydroxyisobutyrate dehydrogenase-like beta-hydroxyacid dehydrogenase
MSAEPLKIAFLGIGLMGLPMARNLLHAGFGVTAWNRSREKAKALEAFGGKVCASAHDAAGGADVVITMLSDGPAVADLLFAQGVAEAMHAGAVFIDMSSIRPDEAREHAGRLAALGVAALDAPVSGGTRGADAGTLAIMAGGAAEAFAKAEPVLKAMGRPTHVGPSGCGQIAKLANQGIVAITIGAVAEAVLLAEKAGLAKGALRQALAGGFADSVILQQHGGRMEERNFAPGGPAAYQLKDLNNLLGAGDTLGLKLPLATALRARFAALVDEMDGAMQDHSALFLELLAQQKDAGSGS